jgi:GR25 family glycosyltransferase involved in LPS biosynthesis
LAIIYQISLHGVTAFDARNMEWEDAISKSGCKPDNSWRDPLLNRSILKGEFGCAVSHLRVWEKIANSGVNGVILEEDAIYESIDTESISNILKHHDSAWLGYRWNSI